MERTEFPSTQILRELRAEGKVPYSRVATRSAVLVGVLLGSSWALGRLQAPGELIDLLLSADKPLGAVVKATHAVKMAGLCVLAPVFGGLAAWILSWAAQTRCLFLPGVGTSTAAGVLGNAPEDEVGRVVLARKVLMFLLALAVAAGVWYFSVKEWAVVLREGSEFLVEMVPRYAPLLLGPLCVALVGLGFGAHLVARIVFLFKHRVTRAEVARDL